MLLKSIKLENIRSFLKQEIHFTEGISLLAGDIGAGKSTIFQSIEFALFGLKRGELTGNTLLRNGKDQASIELTFTLQQKEIFIKRSLKRTPTGINQEFGYLSINSKGQEYTSSELKQKIFELLNYPQETLTKKSLIYRYTVYTPQEEMKTILSGEAEDRMETLRRVFNIDKYKRIRENSKIVSSKLREKRKEYAGKIYDLEDKRKLLKEKQNNIQELNVLIEKIILEVEEKKKIREEKKQNIQETEEQINQLNTLKKNLSLQELTLKNKSLTLERIKKEIEIISKEVTTLPLLIEVKNIKPELKRYQDLITTIELHLKETRSKIQDLITKKKISEERINKISLLDTCPTCFQNVNETHKHLIHTREQEKIQTSDQHLKDILKEENDADFGLEKLKQELHQLQEQDKQAEITKIKKEEAEKKQTTLNKLQEEKEKIQKEAEDLQNILAHLTQEIETYKNLEINYETLKIHYEQALKKEQETKIHHAQLFKEKELETKQIFILTQEVEEKEKIQLQLQHSTTLQNWIEETFFTTMESIELQVLQRIHHNFNVLFQKWFKLLIEGEILTVKLDKELTPLLEQNGYDTDYSSLSGGEKTAAALAYSLALNQAINDVVANINTKNLIMLDEPTDGFSTEQIEKLRDVLQELNMKQVIIVSHEQEIESFANTILRLGKKDHVSTII